MASFFDKLRDGLGRLTPRQRVQIAVAALATLAMVWGVSVYATRVRYGVLYSNLEREDAAAVIASLGERQVPYRVAAGGTIVEVPVEQVDELRLALAGDGLPPGGGVGFEIFDRPTFGLSDFVQNVNYRRALERELARTIQSLDVVDSARVHLALPPESVFADEKREPSASVVVRLRSAASLPPARVSAIAHLVASAVEGLDPQAVSVIDGEGRMLTESEGEAEVSLSASQLQARQALERGIESTLLSILEPVVGAGRVRARATVELNMTRVERTEETYDPDVSVVRSETKDKSKQTSERGGGVPGTASNLPGGGGSAVAGVLDETQRTTTNFELNRTVATIAEPVGTLRRQSVAVVVAHAIVEQTDTSGQAQRLPTPRTPEEMSKIRDLVRAAIGIDEKRGDVLIVENVPFDETASPGEAVGGGGGFGWNEALRIARYGALPLAVLLLALLVVRPGIAALRSLGGSQAVPVGLQGPQTVSDLQARLKAELARGLPLTLDAGTPLRRKLIEAASEDPQAAALVVRGWLEAGRPPRK